MATSHLVPLFALCGCGRIAFDPLGGAGDDGMSATCAAVVWCPTTASVLGNMATTGGPVTATADYGVAGSCGGNPGAEAIFRLTTVVAGHVTLQIADTGPYVLYARDACCAGVELGCTTTPMTGLVVPCLADHDMIVFGDGAIAGAQLTLVASHGP